MTKFLEEMLSDLAFYQYPDLLVPEISVILEPEKVNKELVEKYAKSLSAIKRAKGRTDRYEYYFEKFYPPDGVIEDFEVLEYHTHAYLQDMTILRNRIIHLMGDMKNDLKKIAINDKEVRSFFEAGVEKTEEVFESVLAHRNPHSHSDNIFYDGDLLKAENAFHARSMFENPVVAGMLKEGAAEIIFARLAENKRDALLSAKSRWIKIARDNSVQTEGYIEAIFIRIRPLLYDYLNIKPIKEAAATAGFPFPET